MGFLTRCMAVFLIGVVTLGATASSAAQSQFALRKDDVVVFLGGTNMVHLQQAGHLEAMLTEHEAIDTNSSGGRLVFHMFGALAEFEKNLVRERTQAGLEAARSHVERAHTDAPMNE